ncbi:restriction endonuclease subunit S [uncultured Desulfobulbus sp.]|uniref:restriction endonuclease subunit S n=1 Tax=uncultured Desulfobulbus sp. TaxID=239745 RepID=UPI0029C8661D|nr:restriction endonuclease subunit S [uncultured Desulfobulbus sp.]
MREAIKHIPFGQVAEFRNGLNFGKDSHGKGCLLVGIPDFKDRFTPKYEALGEINPDGIAKTEDYLQKGDIVFVRSNGNKELVGRSLYVDKQVKALFSGFCIRARITSNAIDPNFCAYYTKTRTFKDSISSSAGTNINNLNQEILSQVKIPLFTKNEQLAIAKVLAVLDKKIECNNRINAELEAMAKTLYDYWFVQFDFPDENGKPFKSSGGRMVYNTTLNRDIPAGWKDITIADCASLSRGVTYGKNDVRSKDDIGVIGVLRATNITGNQVDLDDLVYLPEGTVSEDQFMNAFESLIVMSSGSKDHIGKNGIYYSDRKVAFGAFCSKLSINEGFVFYVSTFLNSPWFKVYIKNQCLGTNINNLTNDHIKECRLVKPDVKILTLFEKTMSEVYKKIASNSIENRVLKDLRDWLLPMLMNGQVTVA